MKRPPHHFVPFLRRMPWPVCRYCGLLRLRNDATDAAVRAGCER